jgi:hypothetical protein
MHILPSRAGSTWVLVGMRLLVDLKPTGPNPKFVVSSSTAKLLSNSLQKRLYYKLNPRTEERYK